LSGCGIGFQSCRFSADRIGILSHSGIGESVAWLPRRCCLLSEKVSGTLEPVRRAKLFTSSEGSRHLFGQTLRKATKAQRPVIRLRLCAFARAMPNPPLRDQLLANAGLADNVDGPIAGSHELLGSVDADLAVDGHRQ